MFSKEVEEYLFLKSKDPNMFVLGRLCKHGHDNDGKSIRYKSTGNCLRCQDKYYFNNWQKIQHKYQNSKKRNLI